MLRNLGLKIKDNFVQIIILLFLSFFLSLNTGIIFHSISGTPYSYRNILLCAGVSFMFVFIPCLWIILKYHNRIHDLLADYSKYMKNNLSSMIINGLFLLLIIFFLSQGLVELVKQPNFIYQVSLSPGENNTGSLCIVDFKNTYGHVFRYNENIKNINLSGNWELHSNECEAYLPARGEGEIHFENVGPVNDVLTIIINGGPDEGKIVLKSSPGEELAQDLNQPIETQKIEIWGLGTQMMRYSIRIILALGLLSALILISGISALLFSNTKAKRSAIFLFGRKIKWIALLLVILYVGFFFYRPWSLTSSDVAYYLSLAKNIYLGNGYVDANMQPAIYRGPVLPALIALGYHLFGYGFSSALLVQRIFWALSVFTGFFLGKALFGYRVGVLSAAFIMLSGVINRVFMYIWADGPLLFLALLLQLVIWHIFKNEKKSGWYLLMGVLFGIAYLLKETILFLVPLPLALWVLFKNYRTRKNLLRLLLYLAVFSLFVLGWMGYKYLVGASPAQVLGDFNTGLRMVSLFYRMTTGSSQSAATTVSSSAQAQNPLAALTAIFITYYQRDIALRIPAAGLTITALLYAVYQALKYRNPPDIFLLLGLLFFSVLIPAQVRADFGTRHNLLLYSNLFILLASVSSRIFIIVFRKSNRVAFILFSILYAGLILDDTNIRNIRTSSDFVNLGYFSDTASLLDYIDTNISEDENILVTDRIGATLFALSQNSKPYYFLNDCRERQELRPANLPCSPPYIAIWVQFGMVDPSQSRSYILAYSEPELIRQIKEVDAKYIIVTPRYHMLSIYLDQHPAFLLINEVNGIRIFKIIRPVQPINELIKKQWNTCIGKNLPEFFYNFENALPAEFTRSMNDFIHPRLGLTKEDLNLILDNSICTFEE